MSQHTLGSLLLAATVVLVILALATLWPVHGLILSDLGYYTLCPFAPWSTLGLLVAAGICWSLYRHVRLLEKTPSR